MSKHGAREQKRLAKRKARRADKQVQLAVRSSPDPGIRLRGADRWPIVAALVPEKLWTIGIGQLIIARRMPDGRLACAIFLIDVLCLGAKDAFWRVLDQPEFDKHVAGVEENGGPLLNVPPEYLAKLVHGAVEYARSFAIPPHPDYRHASMLLSGIDDDACREEFQFGQNGKPCYISGPFDSPEKSRWIATRIGAAGGRYTFRVDESDICLMDEDE